MSKIIKGDITKVITSGYIMHQTNYYGNMGAGVAKAIAKKWPAVNHAYKQYCQQVKLPTALFGQMQLVKANDNLTIVNSFTEWYANDHIINAPHRASLHGANTDEDKLIANIQTMATIAAEHDTTLAIPARIGSGIANGDWHKIHNAIKDINNLIIVNFN